MPPEPSPRDRSLASPDDLAVLGIQVTGDGAHAVLPVTPGHCTPFGFLYGGVGIAACAAAAEAVTGRPLVWVTTQFVGNAFAGEDLEITVELEVAARATTQAVVKAQAAGRLVFQAVTAHTVRPVGEAAHWGGPPAVPGPDDCEPFVFPHPPQLGESFMDRLDRRVPPGTQGAAGGRAVDGRVAMWARVAGWPVGSAASQAYVADIVPMAVNLALGRDPGGTSLDNTLRVVRTDPHEWVLLDIEAQGFSRSIGHGQVRLWSPGGDLLGVGSQTCIVRTSHHDRPRAEPHG